MKHSGLNKLDRCVALANQDYKCKYCRQQLNGFTATLEHRVAKSKGGSRYDKENLAASCVTCNKTKGSRSESEFLSVIKKPPNVNNSDVEMLIWATRKINLQVERSIKRIMQFCR